MTPRVSVLMPVRNGLPWLPEALTSLSRQTLRAFEILVLEDGSTDGTPECLRRWARARPRTPGWAGRICTRREQISFDLAWGAQGRGSKLVVRRPSWNSGRNDVPKRGVAATAASRRASDTATTSRG